MKPICRRLFRAGKYILIIALTVRSFSVTAQGAGEDKIHFYEDTVEMKTEILRYIPIGSSLEKARDILQKNELKYKMKTDASFSDGKTLKKHMDYLYFEKSTTGNGLIRKRWQFAIVYKDDKITAILVSFGRIGT